MGGSGKGGNKDGVNVAGARDYLQGNRAVDVFIWKKELCGKGGHDKITRGIT